MAAAQTVRSRPGSRAGGGQDIQARLTCKDYDGAPAVCPEGLITQVGQSGETPLWLLVALNIRQRHIARIGVQVGQARRCLSVRVIASRW